MFTKNNVKISLEMAFSAQAKGKILKPKPSTPLHIATNGHPLVNVGLDSDLSADAFIDAVVKASEAKNKITGEHDHDESMERASEPVVQGLRQQLHFIVTEVIPTLNVIQSSVQKRVEHIQQNTGNQYNIVDVSLPNIVKNPEFMGMIQHTSQSVQGAPGKERLPGMTLGKFTTPMVREILKTEFQAFGTDFLEWLVLVTDETIDRVYNVLFNDCPETRQRFGMFFSLDELATDLDSTLLIYCLTSYYCQDTNIPPNAGLTYVEYVNAIKRVVSASASYLVSQVSFIADRIKRGTMSALVNPSSNDSLFDIHVQKEVYTEWLAQGGDVTALLGYAISHTNIYDLNISELTQNQANYIAKWTAYLHQARLMFNNEFEVVIRESLVGALREWVRQTSAEKVEYQGSKGDEIINTFISNLKAMPLITRDTWSHQSTLAICRTLYSDTSAETIISKMAALEEQEPNVEDPRQYAGMALFEYLVDWVLGQLEVSNVAVGRQGKQADVDLTNSVVTLSSVNELVFNVAQRTLGQETSTNVGNQVQLTDRSSIPYIASIVKNRLNRLYGI